MEICLFIVAASTRELDAATANQFAAALSARADAIAGLRRMVVHVGLTGGITDPYLHQAASPRFALQLYFDEMALLEASLKEGGPLREWLDPAQFAAAAECEFTQQVMAVRHFSVPEPRAAGQADAAGGSAPAPETTRCTYLVSYEGEAENYDAWLGHYVDHHPVIMARFPGIREIEIYTRMDYRSALPAARSRAMQRNKVVFDSPEALSRALTSPVRHEMRDDFKKFPPFIGENFHFPMISTYWTRAPSH
ncbi:MAG: ethyl tert-butyl ether degradation protein EthD [Janthinobacterium lividum]